MDTPIATDSVVLGRILSRQARYRPDHLAVVFEHERLSYAALDGGVNRWANALSGLGVARGDRVATLWRARSVIDWNQWGRCNLEADDSVRAYRHHWKDSQMARPDISGPLHGGFASWVLEIPPPKPPEPAAKDRQRL
jgi:hypothetical protein